MPVPKFGEQKLASRILYAMAARTSRTVDKFSNWFAIGFSAVLSLFVSNIDKLKFYLNLPMFIGVVVVYVLTLILLLVQKRISITVQAAYGGSRIVESYLEKIDQGNFDLSVVSQQIERATMWPGKRKYLRVMEKIQRKIANGDIVWPARSAGRRAQRQQWVVWLQVWLTIGAICLLLYSIKWHQLMLG